MNWRATLGSLPRFLRRGGRTMAAQQRGPTFMDATKRVPPKGSALQRQAERLPYNSSSCVESVLCV